MNETKCIYCNQRIEDKVKEIEIGNESISRVNACSKNCQKKTVIFFNNLASEQKKLFLLVGLLLILNLLLQVWKLETNYHYLVLALMGLLVVWKPFIFIRVRSYMTKGVVTTNNIIRISGGIIFLLGIMFYFSL